MAAPEGFQRHSDPAHREPPSRRLSRPASPVGVRLCPATSRAPGDVGQPHRVVGPRSPRDLSAGDPHFLVVPEARGLLSVEHHRGPDGGHTVRMPSGDLLRDPGRWGVVNARHVLRCRRCPTEHAPGFSAAFRRDEGPSSCSGLAHATVRHGAVRPGKAPTSATRCGHPAASLAKPPPRLRRPTAFVETSLRVGSHPPRESHTAAGLARLAEEGGRGAGPSLRR